MKRLSRSTAGVSPTMNPLVSSRSESRSLRWKVSRGRALGARVRRLVRFKSRHKTCIYFLKAFRSHSSNRTRELESSASARETGHNRASPCAPKPLHELSNRVQLRDRLRLASFNCRDLCKEVRLQELVKFLELRSVHVLGIQEHRLRLEDPTQVSEKELGGGWVLIYSSAWGPKSTGGVGMILSPLFRSSFVKAELVSERILTAHFTAAPLPALILTTVYSPTATPVNKERTKEFYDLLSGQLRGLDSTVPSVVLGDFNAVLLKKQGGSLFAPPNQAENLNSEPFLEFLAAHRLRPVNRIFQKKGSTLTTYYGPKRKHNKRRKVCLDYVLTTDRFRRSARDTRVYTPWPVISDHRMVTVDFRLRLRTSPSSGAVTTRLADTSGIGRSDSVTDAVDKILQTHATRKDELIASAGCPIYQVIYDQIGAAWADVVSILPPVPRKKKPPDRLLPRDHDVVKHARLVASYGNPADAVSTLEAAYEKIHEAELTTICEQVHRCYHDKSRGAVFKAIRALKPPISRPLGLLPTAKAFGRHFSSYLSAADSAAMRKALATRLDSLPESFPILFTSAELSAALSASKSYATPGRDGIPVELLKRPCLAPLLLEMFNDILCQEESPNEFKQSVILPLPKRGSLSDLDNYRGIALTPSLSKLFNRLLLARVRAVIDPSPEPKTVSGRIKRKPEQDANIEETEPFPPPTVESHQSKRVRYRSPSPLSDTLSSSGFGTVEPTRPLRRKRRSAAEILADETAGLQARTIQGTSSRLLPSQAGFRCGRSCAEQVYTLRRVLEVCQIYRDKSAVVCFIDFRKAFDSLSRDYLLTTLQEQNLPPYLIRAIFSLYLGAEGMTLTGGFFSPIFPIDHGVLQGDTLSPLLFVMALDRIMRLALNSSPLRGFLLRERDGRRNPEVRIPALAFADDIALIGNDFDEAQHMVNALQREALAAGLHINVSKTKVFVCGELAHSEPTRSLHLTLRDSTPTTSTTHFFERVTEFKYLGCQISSASADISARSKSAGFACGQLSTLWKAPLAKVVRATLFKSLIEPILFYGCETWALTKSLSQKLVTKWFTLLRWTIGVSRKTERSNSALLGELSLSHPLQVLRERFLGFLGHSLRARERELSSLDSLSPLSQILIWQGEAERVYSKSRGVQNQRYVQNRGQGNRSTLPRFSLGILDSIGKDFENVIRLAQMKEKWRGITKTPFDSSISE